MDNNEEDNSHLIIQLQQTIKDAEKQIEEIQKDCSHETTKIKNLNPTGASDIRLICLTCQQVVGYPSQEELDKWMNGF